MFTLKLLFPGKMLSGEEDGLEDDAERTEVTTGSFTGEVHLPRGNSDSLRTIAFKNGW